MLQTVKLNNGTEVLAKEYKGKLHAATFVNNLQAETNQVLVAATGVICDIYTPAMSRIKYIRIIKK